MISEEEYIEYKVSVPNAMTYIYSGTISVHKHLGSFEKILETSEKYVKIVNDHEDQYKVEYFKDGKEHNDHGPSSIEYDYKNPYIYYAYAINGLFHKMDGPARCYFWGKTRTMLKSWYINGKLICHIDTTDEEQPLPYYINNDDFKFAKFAPMYEGNLIINDKKLTRDVVLKTMIENREYGMFLKRKLDEQRMSAKFREETCRV